jgi:hypothetical protein
MIPVRHEDAVVLAEEDCLLELVDVDPEAPVRAVAVTEGPNGKIALAEAVKRHGEPGASCPRVLHANPTHVETPSRVVRVPHADGHRF